MGGASLTGRVNQQLYHAELLLTLRNELDQDAMAYRAQSQALNDAALSALYSAYRLFLLEVADACQLRQQPESLETLIQLLDQEDRSHAVVNTLSVLAHQDESDNWLQHLLQQQQTLVGQAVVYKAPATTGLIAVTEIHAAMDTQDCVAAFKAFIAEQREYLQEW